MLRRSLLSLQSVHTRTFTSYLPRNMAPTRIEISSDYALEDGKMQVSCNS